MEKKIKFIKNRSDIGAGTRGADMGIDAIEIAAINAKSDLFNRIEYVDVDTHNESIYDKVKNSFAKRISHVYEQCQRVRLVVESELNSGYIPILLSGDHSSALGTISGIRSAHPDKRLGVIWIDAHADLHSPYTSPSGNIHGMPLGAAIHDDNLDDRVNEVSDETKLYWNKMKNIAQDAAKVNGEDIVMFGVRDTEEPEQNQMARYNIKNFMVAECRHVGFQNCVKEALKKLEPCDEIYISFDVDSMDCDMISYGTGTPVQKGFDQHEIMQLLKAIYDSGKVSCIEFVEVNPLLDKKGNKMAETAFEILEDLVNHISH